MPYFKLGMDKKLIVPYAEYMKAMKPDFKFVGDTSEIVDLVRSLNLPSANSVKLVGPRGAGTTALMDALVHHQTSDFMPDDFMVRPIFKFNGNNLFSTSDSKAIEARFQSAMDELQTYFRQRKVKPILVLDDGCTFADNAPQHVINSLIEACVRADYIDVIVAVDKKKEVEFNEAHPEFVNSFTTKEVDEPDGDKLRAILKHNAIKHQAEGVIIDDDAIDQVIDITSRFKGMYGTAQPNRAIRLLDSAATAFRIDIRSRPPGSLEKESSLNDIELKIKSDAYHGDELESLHGQAETLKIELEESQQQWNEHRSKIKSLQDSIRKFDVLIATNQQEVENLDNNTKNSFFNDLKKMYTEAEENDEIFKNRRKQDILNLDRDTLLDFAEFDILVHRNPKVKELKAEISKHTNAVQKLNDDLISHSEEMHQDAVMPISFIDDIATEVTKTPVGGVSGRLRDNLRNGEALMQESVYGQDHVIKPIVQSLQRAAAGLNDPDRPLGCYMIAGPPGTGKSWTAKQLAVKLFGSEDYYVELNMQDYMQEHTIASLIGAPPGYSGHGKRGKLIEIGQDKPFCVLCLDEIEKAHPDIRQALLAVKGKGYLRGLDGEEADFRNIVIVETSNFGNDKGIWYGSFEDGERQLHELLRNSGDVFSPEYLDRNDAILCAGPLSEEPLMKIVAKEIKTMQSKMQKRHPNLSVDLSEEDIRAVVRDHCIGKSGRRAEMTINRMVGDELTSLILSGQTEGILKARYNSEKQDFEFEFSVNTEPKLEQSLSASAEFANTGGLNHDQ